jgi:hypothetical protein
MESFLTRLHFQIICGAVAVLLPTCLCPMVAARTTDYLVDVWDTSSGLPRSTVTAVTQTPDGYIWVGTEFGLARFDVVRFVTFTHENTRILENPEVDSLLLDDRGTLSDQRGRTGGDLGRSKLHSEGMPLGRRGPDRAHVIVPFQRAGFCDLARFFGEGTIIVKRELAMGGFAGIAGREQICDGF